MTEVLFQSPKTFTVPYYLPRTLPRAELMKNIERVLDSRWLTNFGPCENELTEKIAAVHNVKHCVLVSNATLGLMVALRALDLEGDVLLPGYSFIASAHSIRWLGLNPVFCDVNPDTFTISPTSIQEKITAKTSAIMGVHVYGQTCEIEAIQKIADSSGIRVLYDAAHGFGVKRAGISVGNFGDLEVLSFHTTKIFSSIEGGAILTNDDDIAYRARSMINFGITGPEKISFVGTNAKMNELCAAYGLTFYPHFQESIDRLKTVHERYRANIQDVPGIKIHTISSEHEPNYQYFVTLVDSDQFGLSRNEFALKLAAKGIQTRKYFYPPQHLCQPYASDPQYLGVSLSVVEDVASRVLCMPCYFDLTNEQVDSVCNAIGEIYEETRRSTRLSSAG